MKFAWALATTTATAAAATEQQQQQQLQSLLTHAVHAQTGRRFLDENNNNNNGITAAHSLQFQACTSLTTASPDDDVMFGDDFVEYTQNGKIVAAVSYVLFSVCETDSSCYYNGEDEVYMVDLATYMGATVNKLPQENAAYCEVCQEAQDWCENGQYEQEEEQQEDEQQDDQEAQDDEDEEEEEEQGDNEQEEEEENNQDEEDNEQDDEQDDEGEEDGEQDNGDERRRRLRKLQNNNNFAVVDCDTCAARNCFEEENNDDQQDNEDNENQVNDENIAAWVEDIIECQQTNAQWNGADLYAGFICNSDGSGVEIGVFLDEDCTIYTNQRKYKRIADEDEYGYLYNSQNVVTYPFLNDIDCAEEIEYITPEEYQEMQENGEDQNDNNNDNEVGDANDYCQGVFQDDTMPLYDCNEDGQEDEAEDEVEEEEDNDYDWYTYVLSADDMEDDQAVCKILQTMEGEYTVVYDSDEDYGSGSLFNYNQGSSGLFGGDNSAALLGAVIIGVIVAVIALGFIVHAACCTPSPRKERLLSHNYEGSSLS